MSIFEVWSGTVPAFFIMTFGAGWALGHFMGRRRVLDLIKYREVCKRLLPHLTKEIDDDFNDVI